VGIKWPNDLFLDGRKVGGVLCDSLMGPGAVASVVVGVGLNLRQPTEGFPGDIALTAASLEGLSGKPVRRSEVASGLMTELRRLRGPSLQEATDRLRVEFGPRDVLAGREIVTAQGPGTARGIDESGALMLQRPDGVRVRVTSGSVDFG
jgi:BirA family biotin operon repressor/biotin-[acetyl-CoA-carboxylase] ligase